VLPLHNRFCRCRWLPAALFGSTEQPNCYFILFCCFIWFVTFFAVSNSWSDEKKAFPSRNYSESLLGVSICFRL